MDCMTTALGGNRGMDISEIGIEKARLVASMKFDI